MLWWKDVFNMKTLFCCSEPSSGKYNIHVPNQVESYFNVILSLCYNIVMIIMVLQMFEFK